MAGYFDRYVAYYGDDLSCKEGNMQKAVTDSKNVYDIARHPRYC